MLKPIGSGATTDALIHESTKIVRDQKSISFFYQDYQVELYLEDGKAVLFTKTMFQTYPRISDFQILPVKIGSHPRVTDNPPIFDIMRSMVNTLEDFDTLCQAIGFLYRNYNNDTFRKGVVIQGGAGKSWLITLLSRAIHMTNVGKIEVRSQKNRFLGKGKITFGGVTPHTNAIFAQLPLHDNYKVLENAAKIRHYANKPCIFVNNKGNFVLDSELVPKFIFEHHGDDISLAMEQTNVFWGINLKRCFYLVTLLDDFCNDTKHEELELDFGRWTQEQWGDFFFFLEFCALKYIEANPHLFV